MVKWILLAVILLVLLAIAGVVFWVQSEAPFRRETLSEGPGKRALILYHPSRDAHFSDDLTEALALGFADEGLAVDRWTMTASTPERPENYDVVAIVSNTFFGSPDWPTQRYLKRADLAGQNTIAIIAGGGNTNRAERLLRTLIENSGAQLVALRALWIKRPNEPGSDGQDNRQLAMRLARAMAQDANQHVQSEDHAHKIATVRNSCTAHFAIVSPPDHDLAIRRIMS